MPILGTWELISQENLGCLCPILGVLVPIGKSAMKLSLRDTKVLTCLILLKLADNQPNRERKFGISYKRIVTFHNPAGVSEDLINAGLEPHEAFYTLGTTDYELVQIDSFTTLVISTWPNKAIHDAALDDLKKMRDTVTARFGSEVIAIQEGEIIGSSR